MVTESLLAAAWAAGVIEGGSVLSHATSSNPPKKIAKPELIIPALFYGVLSVPLSVIGAAPGSSVISRLPFAPKTIHAPPELSATSQAHVQSETSRTAVEKSDMSSNKGKRRVDIIREENRKNLAAARKWKESIPPPLKEEAMKLSNTSHYLATLDGRPLPTPLAEAMRRTRFLLAGAFLVTVGLARRAQIEKVEQEQREKLQRLRQIGKDLGSIQSIISASTYGAVVRVCNSWEQVPHAATTGAAIIPLLHPQVPLTSPPKTPYWDQGTEILDWKSAPVSSDWLMRTKAGNIFVLEADVTPSSLEGYCSNVIGKQESLNLSLVTLMSNTLASTAVENHVLSSCSQAVQVVLGTRERSLLRIEGSQIYVNAANELRAQIRTEIKNMSNDVAAEFLDTKAEEKSQKEKEDEEAAAANPKISELITEATEDVVKPGTPEQYLQFALLQAVTLVDMVGSTIRQATSLTANFIKKKYEDLFLSHRVVHVLSDEDALNQFLKVSLEGWRVVWYDCNKAGDLEQYTQVDTPITIVCCSSDAMTKLFLNTFATGKPHVLAIFQQQLRPSDEVHQAVKGVSSLSIQQIHNTIFSRVRDLLLEGKTTKEVQEMMDNQQ